MRRGLLILVVGPSGVGKDTVIQGARQQLEAEGLFEFPRRLITRAPDPEGENHIVLDEQAYEQGVEAGRYLLHWRAHSLGYALPAEAEGSLESGRHVVANVSRTVVDLARLLYPPVSIISVHAPPEVLARRLASRGREASADQQQRLARRIGGSLAGRDVVSFENTGDRQDAIAEFIALLRELGNLSRAALTG